MRQAILVVDDYEINLMLIRDLLESIGDFDVETVSSGLEAIERFKHQSFELILMDICMPEMDGYEAIERLREQGYENRMVVLTANELIRQDVAFKRANIDDVIFKPIDLKELRRIVLTIDE